MKVKLSLAQIYNSKASIEKFANQKLPVKLSFKLLKTRNVINEEFNNIEEQRIALVRQYDPAGEQVPVETRDAFIKEWIDFTSTTTEIDIEKLDIDEIPGQIEISANELVLMSFIFKNFEEYEIEEKEVPEVNATLAD